MRFHESGDQFLRTRVKKSSSPRLVVGGRILRKSEYDSHLIVVSKKDDLNLTMIDNHHDYLGTEDSIKFTWYACKYTERDPRLHHVRLFCAAKEPSSKAYPGP